jgi:hypothetical protein
MIEYLADTNNQLMQIEFLKKLPFLFAPFAFAVFFSFTKFKNTNRLFSIFTVATTALAIVSFVQLIISNDLFNNESYANGAFLIRQKFEEISNLHPTYFGLFATISIFWLICNLYKKTSNYRILLAFAILILFTAEIVIAAKAPFFITVFGSIWLIYKNSKSIKRFIAITISIIVCATLVSIASPSLKNRINEVEDFFISTNLEENTINQRQLILACNVEVLKGNLWLGTGTNKAQILLDDCYQSKSEIAIEKGKYNSHNQYFTIAINYGIFALLVFLVAIYFILKKAKANYYLVATCWVFFIIMLSESILERQMGVYSFLIFSLVILNQPKRSNP